MSWEIFDIILKDLLFVMSLHMTVMYKRVKYISTHCIHRHHTVEVDASVEDTIENPFLHKATKMLCSTVRPLDDVLRRGSRFCPFSKFSTLKIHLFHKVVPGRAFFEWPYRCCDFCCWQIDNKCSQVREGNWDLAAKFSRGSFVALLSRCPKEGFSSGIYL